MNKAKSQKTTLFCELLKFAGSECSSDLSAQLNSGGHTGTTSLASQCPWVPVPQKNISKKHLSVKIPCFPGRASNAKSRHGLHLKETKVLPRKLVFGGFKGEKNVYILSPKLYIP